MRVVGTAGHVDHGKSTLVKRLTGIDPDRLAEEKAREMTIELGFAWLTLPDGEEVGIVDVPGHRDFIENMLAGVGSIDAVLLVIAADEGVMPQTREHLAILDLLGIERGLVVLTKIDLVDDEAWLELVMQDVRDVLQGTTLATAPILSVSAHSGEGIEALLEQLTILLQETPRRANYNRPYLSIDRVFTISGFGTVVTGTLLGGALSVGDEVMIYPQQLRGRIRGLQSHKKRVERAVPGSRVAVNITGIEKRQIARGDLLAYPEQLNPTLLADVHFRYLPDIQRPLKHNAEVKFFSGATERIGRVRLLDSDMLSPGESGWLQIRFEQRTPLIQGERFILRYPSPPETIGGGIIVNPNPGKRWKRHQPQVIAALETRLSGRPADKVAQAAEATEPIKIGQLQQITGYDDEQLAAAIAEALREGLLIQFEDGRVIARTRFHALLDAMYDILSNYHRQYPLRLGMPREELRSRLKLKQATLGLFLQQQEQIIDEGHLVRLKSHKIQFSAQQEAQIRQVIEVLSENPFAPPPRSALLQIVDEEILYALLDLDEIVQVQPEIIFVRDIYEQIVATILQWIEQHGAITVQNLRDELNTSRKYAIGVLEYLDGQGITRRVGDERIRGRNAPA